MPIVTIAMYPGRTQQQKDSFAVAVTRAAAEILKAKESHVVVVFDENPKGNWYQAGKRL